ncbi:MAG TPA: DUF3829 domain-containing protein [Candidatus Paceibacterota bacterium]|nr:DUF3829 domain-containing protein [Candidatus Paceibacterota bacterium]
MIASKKKNKSKPKYFEFDSVSQKATTWIGSNQSLLVHSIIFATTFSLPFFGIAWDTVLLVLTTIVSLEAIYLAIFIQMTVNKNTADIEEIQEDVDEIQEDVEEIQEDVEGIEKDVDEIQKDVDEIQEDVEEIQEDVEEDEAAEIKRDQDLVQKIEGTLAQLLREIEELKNKQK